MTAELLQGCFAYPRGTLSVPALSVMLMTILMGKQNPIDLMLGEWG